MHAATVNFAREDFWHLTLPHSVGVRARSQHANLLPVFVFERDDDRFVFVERATVEVIKDILRAFLWWRRRTEFSGSFLDFLDAGQVIEVAFRLAHSVLQRHIQAINFGVIFPGVGGLDVFVFFLPIDEARIDIEFFAELVVDFVHQQIDTFVEFVFVSTLFQFAPTHHKCDARACCTKAEQA